MTRALVASAIVASAVALAGCSPSTQASTSSADPAAERYCVDHGGTVQTRQPTFGTNNDPSTWIPLGEPIEVCRFQTTEDDANSRIYVDLVTLSSKTPTLAALAYLAKTPVPDGADGNPASVLCDNLGGASGYGTSANGGGLVATDDPDDVVIVPCVFADQSFIEEWGIAYYSSDIIRGIDLATVFALSESRLPGVFEGPPSP